MIQALVADLAKLNHWQIDGLAIFFLLQGMIVAVFPEEVVIGALGVFWHRGQIGFLEALFAIQIGLLPANLGAVFIGRRLGLDVLTRFPFRWFFRKNGVEKALASLKKHGPWIVFTTRFTPTIRGPIYIAVGISQMTIKTFFQIDFLASCLQVPLLLLIAGNFSKIHLMHF